ncbi:Short-chain dehydrogenase/reductase SDR [Penicillium concentricum]|uniref:Short-chain dehydrogenase/reductase SDR n=1 Tax=Penicillium concentricum TaxID=293559 RepID=A0A9W9S7Y4_9EURO|nr:Short-chain dehydrogenase/reductase SDR [Penicillium concentricum]KAJ5373732.1 Short-chain dehydrogenase/reductase SDR [Penicillium concentricum]
MALTIVFITGANRGLGLGLVKGFITKPDHIVIAAVRDPTHSTAQVPVRLPGGEGSLVIVVKYEACIKQSAFDAVKEATNQDISHLDIVFANAGIAKLYPLVKDIQRADIVKHIDVNVISVVSLYQATRDLLQKSTRKPIYAIMGSGAAGLARQPPVPSAAYGASKSIVNWYGVRINAEDEWLNAFVLDPGWVQTDMGNEAVRSWGMEEAPDTLEKSIAGMIGVLSTDTKEQHGGKFVLYSGEVQEW